MKRVSILGATGSIGVNAAAILKHLGGREAFQTVAVTGGANIALLAETARDLGAEIAVTAYEDRLEDLKAALAGSGADAAAGAEALTDAADQDRATGGVDLQRRIYPIVQFCTADGIERAPDDEIAEVYRTLMEERSR